MRHTLSSHVKGGIWIYHTNLTTRCLNQFSGQSEVHNFLLKHEPSFQWLKRVEVTVERVESKNKVIRDQEGI